MEELKTSQEWQEDYREKFIIYDPDGWDRRGDFHYDWYVRKISREEFEKKAMRSTCLIKPGAFDAVEEGQEP